MTAGALPLVRLTPAAPHRPLLVVGPSLGTSAEALWGRCAERLAGELEVVGWDLPGHGAAAPATGPFRIADLARAVVGSVDEHLPGRSGEPFVYAGDSIGGAVGLQLLIGHGERVAAALLACTGARIGTPQAWQDRAATVRAEGTAVLVDSSAERWFGTGFAGREPGAAGRLLDGLGLADAESYALACEALAAFDVRDQLGAVHRPLTLIAGRLDVATPVAGLEEIARSVPGARLVVLDGVAHLAPIEAPRAVADAVRDLAFERPGPGTVAAELDAGMAVRRAVAGDAWVDRATDGATDFTRDFQELITRYAWGAVWTRPGLDRRSRSMITITALVARGHHEELAMHVRGALTNGLTREEIREVLIHSAIYCGVPAANTAFRIAQRVFDEMDGQ